MWPKTIVMTKDECRGALRRLELESYAAMISVFRAQGCLNDVKSKVLEDLRNLFHISLERHRAEARRVANDEQLATIAESLAGPNTWQEWAREGRRPFPLLSRVPPKTALNIIANKIAARVAAENAKLPLPSETGDMYIKERAAKEAELKAAGIDLGPNNNIVVGNPYPPPNIPDGPKRTIKRNAAEGHNAPSRKRAANDASTNKLQNALLRKYQHITSDAISTESPQTSNTQNMYNNQNSTQQHQQQEHNLLQQQELLDEYQLPQTKQRATKRIPLTRRPEAQTRISKRKQNLLLQEQMHMRHHYGYEHLQSGDQISHLDAQAIVANADYIKVDNMPENDAGTYVAATSRRDVSKNYARLHLPATVTSGQYQHLNSPTSATLTPIPSTSASVYNKYEKHATSATLRKFVIDDNQAATLSPQSSHILTFPHNTFSATASKLRAVNTTILPPGTKITAKRMPTSTIVSNAAHNAIAASGLSVLADQASITPALTHAGNSSSTATITPASGTHITKLDMLNNAAAIISGGGGGHAGTIAGGATIMKKLHTPVLISEPNSNNGATNSNLQITPIGSASPGTVFRKPSNIIKTNYISRSASTVTSAGASTAKISTNNINSDCSKLIGNIKLVPTISATPATASQHQFLQQQLKNVNTTGLRTSVKICQSANGKVFIQPANIDSSKTRTPTSNTQKTMPIPISSSTAQSSGSRIAIQKVQIMPATSPTLQNSIANYQQQQQQKSHTIGNKIYKSATAQRTNTGAITQIDNEGSSNTRPQKSTENKQHSTVATILPSSMKSDRNQIISEETPIDILTTPIYVDSTIAGNHPHSHIVDIKEKVTVLSNSPLDPVRRRNITIREKRKEEPTIVLGVTDWEVELDQARAFAAANRLREPYHSVRNRSSYHCEDVQVVVDDSYDDEIIVEDTDDSTTGSTITARSQEYVTHEQGGVEHSGTIIIQPADYADDDDFDETIEIDENSTIEYIEHDPGSEDNMDKTEAIQINAIADREYLNDIAITYATK